ncbi:MAG: YolD-like family protein [Lachnospiraceae bacterium]
MIRKKMTSAERAKQFMPFDALRGFRDALREKERIVVPRSELSEEKKEELDRVLSILEPATMVTVTYYQKEEYVRLQGLVSKIEMTSHILTVVNEKIEFADIHDLEIDPVT